PGGTNGLDPVPVGTFDGTAGHGDGASPWGVHDMAGNATEVVADCYQKYTACSDACVDPKPAPPDPTCTPVGRGGDAADVARFLRSSERLVVDVSFGFRCAH